MKMWRVCLAVLVVFSLCTTLGFAAYTERLSINGAGGEADGASSSPTVDRYGDVAAFASTATNLVEGDTNGCSDIFASKRGEAGLLRVSVDSAGAEADGASTKPFLSPGSNSVVYQSLATNLVAEDAGDVMNVYVTDIGGGVVSGTYLVSVGMAGPADGASYDASITESNQYVAFTSEATNLADGDSNDCSDIFVRDRDSDTTIRVSVDSEGGEANGPSYSSMISADGSHVVFISEATNLVEGDTNGVADVFVYDLDAGTIERVSVDTPGNQANGASTGRPSISGTGGAVAFASAATNLVDGDTNGATDIFVRNLSESTTSRVSVADSTGAQADGDSWGPSISTDGRLVGFASGASNLVADDANGVDDVFVNDSATGHTLRFSVPGDGTAVPRFRDSGLTPGEPGIGEADGASSEPAVAMFAVTDGVPCCTDGRWNVVFTSQATNLVPDDTNDVSDVFMRTLLLHRNNESFPSDLGMICFDRGGSSGEWTDLNGEITIDGHVVPILPPEIDNATKLLLLSDDLISLEAVPDPGFRFLAWDCCFERTGLVSNPMELRVPRCIGGWAQIEAIPYTFTLNTVGDGTVFVDSAEVEVPYSATFYYGDEVTISAAAAVGRVFSGWSGDLTGNVNPATITITGDTAIVAHFPLPTVSLRVGGVGSGTVKVNSEAHALPWNEVFDAGATVTLEAVPAAGQLFTGWSGDVTGDDNPVELVMLEDAHVTASFSTTEVTLTVNGEPGTSVKVNGVAHWLPWSGQFTYGAAVTLEAVPGDCSRFDGWSGAVTGTTNPIIVTMAGNKTVTASFSSISVFTDIGCEFWAAREIAACAAAGIVAGYLDGTYKPDVAVSRDQMATYISRALAGGDAQVPSGPAVPSFPDVATDYWAYKYIEYAKAHDIVTGYPDGWYHPADIVNRGQMAVFIARAMAGGDSHVPTPMPPPTFPDVTGGNDWAWCYKYVEYVVGHSVVQGYPDGNYHPEYEVTRDQMAVFIQRAFELPM